MYFVPQGRKVERFLDTVFPNLPIALVISSMGIEGKLSDTLGEKIFEQTEDVNLPKCKFAPRCPFAQKVCFEESPPYVDVSVGHSVKCHFGAQIYGQIGENGIQKSLNLSTLRNEVHR